MPGHQLVRFRRDPGHLEDHGEAGHHLRVPTAQGNEEYREDSRDGGFVATVSGEKSVEKSFSLENV